jgi:hypothetical protein
MLARATSRLAGPDTRGLDGCAQPWCAAINKMPRISRVGLPKLYVGSVARCVYIELSSARASDEDERRTGTATDHSLPLRPRASRHS